MLNKVVTGTKTFAKDQDIIDYGTRTVVVAYEFSIYNMGDEIAYIQFNGCEDLVELEPGEGFNTNMQVRHAIVKTDGAIIKYSYWL